MSKKLNIKLVVFALALALLPLALPSLAKAHCDSLDGPVLVEAKAALKTGDVTPLLKWVPARDEELIREAFKKTLALGAKGEEVREFAEMYFFETLVRIHRAGEGFAYTGLKATASDAGPAVTGADQALEAGCAHNLTRLVTGEVVEGIKSRFNHTLELKAKAGDSVEAGREYVAAYVDYVHYVEGVHSAAEKSVSHGEAGKADHVEAPKRGCGHK